MNHGNSLNDERLGAVGGGGVLLGILGVGVLPGSPNPDPISDQKMLFFTPVVRPAWSLKCIPLFRPGLYEIMLSPLGLERQLKRFHKIHFEFAYFSFSVIHLELKW